MDTKLKKSKRPLFMGAYIGCVFSFLISVICFMGAATLNSYTGYVEPNFLRSNGYGTYAEFLQDQGIAMQMEMLESHMKAWTFIAIAAGAVALISLIYLVLAVGVKDGEEKAALNRFDRVFAEIQLVGIFLLFFVGGGIFSQFVDRAVNSVYGIYSMTTFEISMNIALAVVLGGGAAALGLGLILSCVKKIKMGEFLDHSLCGWLIHKIYTEIYMGGDTMRKVVMIAILICLLSATVFLAPVMLIVILVFAPKWVHKYDAIRKGIREVSNGNLDYKIPVEGDDELDQLAADINEISKATSVAVQNELKNQRMKTDLISNVSHDLKTPLTSMVTYIDLMKTEGLDSENAPEYLEILEQKTNRLRQLTEDLFEAAKASSGAIPVRMARVDFLSLLNQGLGELNQRVEESGLEFIINAEKDRYFVNADGQLLWRVISNLLGNALKYSQENTRVYIDFKQQTAGNGFLVIMEMKNISKQSLNIDPSELTERFKRGDESRSTEGSGLGLAIAKDLMKLMDGWLELFIDGDLFKVRVMLEAASDEDPIVTPMDMEQGITDEPLETADDLIREMEETNMMAETEAIDDKNPQENV